MSFNLMANNYKRIKKVDTYTLISSKINIALIAFAFKSVSIHYTIKIEDFMHNGAPTYTQ